MSTLQLRVLTYHRVLDPGQTTSLGTSVVSASPADFERQMRHLAAYYHVVSAEEVVAAVRGQRPLPRRAVLLTFDDGYRDFGEIAWPILRRHGLPATLFVPTGFPDQPRRVFWWDHLNRAFSLTTRTWVVVPELGALTLHDAASRRRGLRTVQQHLKSIPHVKLDRVLASIFGQLDDVPYPGSEVLSWNELRSLAREGVTLAPHTRTHPALTRVPLSEVRSEIRGSLDDLRQRVGSVVPIFAYPFGAHNPRVVEVAREEGIEVAVTTMPGCNELSRRDPLQLRRTNVGLRTTSLLFQLRLLGASLPLEQWRGQLSRPSTAQPLLRGFA